MITEVQKKLIETYKRGYDDGALDVLMLLGEQGILPPTVAESLAQKYRSQVAEEGT